MGLIIVLTINSRQSLPSGAKQAMKMKWWDCDQGQIRGVGGKSWMSPVPTWEAASWLGAWAHTCALKGSFILMVVLSVQGAELPHALTSRCSAVVGAIVMQKVSVGPGAMHAGAPSTVPQSTESLPDQVFPLPCHQVPISKRSLSPCQELFSWAWLAGLILWGQFKGSCKYSPELGLCCGHRVASRSLFYTRGIPGLCLECWTLQRAGPPCWGSWVISELDAFPTRSSAAGMSVALPLSPGGSRFLLISSLSKITFCNNQPQERASQVYHIINDNCHARLFSPFSLSSRMIRQSLFDFQRVDHSYIWL